MYLTRLSSTRIPEHEKKRLAETFRTKPMGEFDPDACRAMLFAILETAIRDYHYLVSVEGRDDFSTAETKRIRSMLEDNHPKEFFESQWFQEICHLLELNHSAVRDTVLRELGGLEGQQVA